MLITNEDRFKTEEIYPRDTRIKKGGDLKMNSSEDGSDKLSENELTQVVGGESPAGLNTDEWVWDYNMNMHVKKVVCPICGLTYTYSRGDRNKYCTCPNYECHNAVLIATEFYD